MRVPYRFGVERDWNPGALRELWAHPLGDLGAGPARTVRFQSVRGLPQSRTSRNPRAASEIAPASWTAVVPYRGGVEREETPGRPNKCACPPEALGLRAARAPADVDGRGRRGENQAVGQFRIKCTRSETCGLSAVRT